MTKVEKSTWVVGLFLLRQLSQSFTFLLLVCIAFRSINYLSKRDTECSTITPTNPFLFLSVRPRPSQFGFDSLAKLSICDDRARSYRYLPPSCDLAHTSIIPSLHSFHTIFCLRLIAASRLCVPVRLKFCLGYSNRTVSGLINISCQSTNKASVSLRNCLGFGVPPQETAGGLHDTRKLKPILTSQC